MVIIMNVSHDMGVSDESLAQFYKAIIAPGKHVGQNTRQDMTAQI